MGCRELNALCCYIQHILAKITDHPAITYAYRIHDILCTCVILVLRYYCSFHLYFELFLFLLILRKSPLKLSK